VHGRWSERDSVTKDEIRRLELIALVCCSPRSKSPPMQCGGIIAFAGIIALKSSANSRATFSGFDRRYDPGI